MFEEYVDAITVATARIERLTRAIETEVITWRFAAVVAALQAMRGIQFVHAVTLVAELGDSTRQTGLPKAACDIAWRAQLRLSAKYRRLNARHVNHNKIVVALARELSGFVWAIGQSVRPMVS